MSLGSNSSDVIRGSYQCLFSEMRLFSITIGRFDTMASGRDRMHLLFQKSRRFVNSEILSSKSTRVFLEPTRLDLVSTLSEFRHPSQLESFSSQLGQTSYQHSESELARTTLSQLIQIAHQHSVDLSQLELLRVNSSRPHISAQWVWANSNCFESTRPDHTSVLSGSELARTTSSRLLIDLSHFESTPCYFKPTLLHVSSMWCNSISIVRSIWSGKI